MLGDLTSRGGPLRGIRVLELGHHVAAPMLGMLLADHGADVVKVLGPQGASGWQPPSPTWDLGKQTVRLDMKSRSGLEEARRLVHDTDVLIENFRPGVMDRLGIGFDVASEIRPGIVYCSMPGFGPDHPMRNEAGWEPVIGAITGLYRRSERRYDTGSSSSADAHPQFTPLAAASSYAAMLASVTIAAALYDRTSVDRPVRIEVPLHDAMFTAIGRMLVDFDTFRPEAQFQWPRAVMARQYRCADGRWVQLHGMWPRFLEQTLAAADRSDWYREAIEWYGRDVDDTVLETWIQRFEDLFLERPAAEWETLISAHGGACTVDRSLEEWLSTEHASDAGLVTEAFDVDGRRLRRPGAAVRLGTTAPRESGRLAAPETTGPTVRFPPSHSPLPVIAVRHGPDARPLAGIRVLDLCIVLAGPSCGRALADLGAEVIKIDDPNRTVDPVQYIDVNRGKRSIQLDLKQPAGRDLFGEMAATADVILDNYRAGSLARLGLGPARMLERFPRLVYASMNCFGYGGPWERRPGWEQSAQAASGMQVRHGGSGGRPRLVHYPVCDYGTGLLAAYGVVLALMERRRTGRGDTVAASLAATAGLLQAELFDVEVRAVPSGPDAMGWSPSSRLYRTADDWIYVHADGASFGRLLDRAAAMTPEGSEEPEHDAGGTGRPSSADLLESMFRQHDTAYWVDEVRRLGATVAAVADVAQVRSSTWVRRAGLVVRREHPGIGFAQHVGVTVRTTPRIVEVSGPAPISGGQTIEILRDLGYDDTRIARWADDGVIGIAASR